MDPRLGTDTSGPGEAAFAIRFNGELDLSRKKRKTKTSLSFTIVSGKNKVHMAEYRGAKFCHRCNTVDTSGFYGPGGGFLVLVAVVACHYFYYH